MITSMTHVGTTMYVSIGYEIDGELGADATEEESAEFDMMVAMMPEVDGNNHHTHRLSQQWQ